VWLTAAAFGHRLSPGAPLFVIVCTAIAVSVPSSPGYIGPFHYAAFVAFTTAGLEKSTGLTAAVLLHLVVTVPVTMLGVAALWAAGLSFSDLRQRQ
jgi:hypothetical protein